MKVLLKTSRVTAKGEVNKPGDVIEVDDWQGKRLISLDQAERAPDKPRRKKPDAKRDTE